MKELDRQIWHNQRLVRIAFTLRVPATAQPSGVMGSGLEVAKGVMGSGLEVAKGVMGSGLEVANEVIDLQIAV
jgi:hypothetical protein